MKLNPLKIPLILFFFVSSQLYGQTKESYCKEWNNATDTISSYSRQLDCNYRLLPKVDLKCKVSILANSGFMYQKLKKHDSAIINLNKAIVIGEQLNLTEALIPIYNSKAYVYAKLDKVDEAILLLKKSKKILDTIPDNENWYSYFQAQAYMADLRSEYDEAIAFMDTSIVFSKRIKSDMYLYYGYFNKATYQLRKSDYESASKIYYKTIELANKTHMYESLADSYYMLAVCYNRMEQEETALKYFRITLKEAIKTGNEHIVIKTYSEMANSQLVLKEIDNALISIDSAIIKAKIANKYGILSRSYNTKASIYFKYLKEYNQAEYYFKKSYENALKANKSRKDDDLTKTPAIQGMVEINMHKQNYKKAKEFLDILKVEADKSGLLIYKKESNKLHSEYYEAIGQPRKAIKHLRAEYKIKDSISNEKVKTQVAKLEKQYDTKTKELEIVKLDKEKSEQIQLTAKAEAKQKLYLLAAILLLVLLVFGYLLFRKLKKQKEELASTNKVKNRLFSIIAHDIRGMIIPFQRSGKILTHHIEEKNYDKTATFSQELQKNATGLSNMLDNLLSWSLEQMNGYKMHPELLYLSKELEDIKSNFSQQAEFKNTKIDIVYKEDVALTIDKGSFHIIYRNLIGNALKYTENGIIRIEFNRDFKTLKSTITDTGIGMSQEQLNDLFSLDTKSSSPGTKEEKGTGLGLSLVQRFVTMNKGNIEVSSEKRVGTKFNLNFQLSAQDIIETENINKKEQSA